MPYDTYVWGEEVQNTSLLGVLGKGPTGIISFTGDTNTIPKGKGGVPYLFGLGGVSDTKPNASGITPQYSNRAAMIYGPAAINFAKEGWLDFRQPGLQPRLLQEGETLSGFGCNTNVSEGIVIGANISYGGVSMPRAVRVRELFIEEIAITSAAAVTSLSGAVDLTTATTSDTWLDTTRNYVLTGVVGNVSAATLGGILHVTNLGGPWAGFAPGIPLNPLSAVTFTPGQPFTAFAEPIPFSGAALPNVSMTATTAGAITCGLVIGKL